MKLKSLLLAILLILSCLLVTSCNGKDKTDASGGDVSLEVTDSVTDPAEAPAISQTESPTTKPKDPTSEPTTEDCPCTSTRTARENEIGSTCKTEGSYDEVVYCSACDKELSRTKKTIPVKTEHIPSAAVEENRVDSTCKTEGSYDEVVYCSVCDKELSRTKKLIAKAGHVYDQKVITDDYLKFPATETESAIYYYSCTCGEKSLDMFAYGEPLGHTHQFDKTVVSETYFAQAATCTESAKYYHSCKCGEMGETTFTSGDPLGHADAIDAAVEPNCTATGLTQGKHCSVCKTVLTAQSVIPAKGHNFDEWVITKKPTESTKGEMRRNCANCDYFETSVVAELAHDHSNHGVIILDAVAPTCTATGLTEGKKCSGCGEILVAQTTVPANGHDHEADIIAPSCTQKGYTTYICHCGDTYMADETDALGHTEVIDAAVAPTCTETGLTEGKHCSVCATVLVAPKVINANGHTEVIDKAVTPTCMGIGLTESKYCFVCYEVLKNSEVVPATGHSFVDGKCKLCGEKEPKLLEVVSASVDKTLVMANDQVTFNAVTNKDGDDITIFATIYLEGKQIAEISDVGNLKYTPTSTGRYDAEITVTDDGKSTFTYYLKSCFEVKPYWNLSEFSESSNNVFLGEILTLNSKIEGDTSDLSYNITVYKDGIAYYSIEDSSKIDFYPNAAGSYYAVILATDSYGESQTAQSGTVVVKEKNITNPTLNVNYGTTLNIDELDGKGGDQIVVSSGKNITITWDKLSTDSYYRVHVYSRNKDADTYNETFKKYTSNSYTISSSNLTAGLEYTVTIRRHDASGNVLGNVGLTFTVGGANSIMLEKRFEVISPVMDSLYAQDDVTVQWIKLNYASKYVLSLEYSCGASYHGVLNDIEISNTQNSYTIPKSILHQGCQHRLTVYAYDSLGNVLSKTIRFRLEGKQAIFELDKPEITSAYFYEVRTDDMKSYPSYENIIVTWTDIPAAAYYSISIDSSYSAIDDPVLINADNIQNNTFTIPINSLVSGCVYSVRISAYCSDGHKCTSNRGYFRVPYSNGTTIQGPELTSHDFSREGSSPTTIVEQELTIVWKPVSAAVNYNVYWSEEGNEDCPEFELKGLKTTSVTIPREHISSLGNESDYVLEIVAKDSNGITESSYYYVRVVESALEAPVLISPTLATDDEETLPSFEDDITLTWNVVEGAVSYRVRVWECYNGDLIELISQDGITETSFDIPLDELYFGGVFRISIRANDQYGGSSKSSKYYFQVGESDYLGLSVDNWNPIYEADYKFTYVETVGDWTAKTSASWIALSSTSGTGTTRLKVSVTENTESSARFGRITFTNEDGGRAVFSITQDANNASQTSVVQIVSPSQNEVVENDMLTVKWTAKHAYAYFELDLLDLTNNKLAHHQSDITALYQQIPANCIEQGHTYQLTISVFDYSEKKGAETSIIFEVEGDIIPPSDDTNDDENDDGDEIPQPPRVCSHTIYKKELVDTFYTNLIKASSAHDGYSLYNKVCMSCGVSLGTERIVFSNSTHNVNSKGYCSCGFTYTYDYTSWSATNASNQKVIVYQTPESTSQYGYINAGEKVTVLAECCGRYLIQYTLDGGSGIKQGYVNKYSLSEDKPSYSIYVDDEYFNAPSNAMVAEKNTYYQIYIKNNETNELFKYGNNGLICVSSDENIVTVGASGIMIVRGVGPATIKLMQDGDVLDELMIYGCKEDTRITNYSAIRDSELYAEGFAPNCRLKVFNYESMFIADDSWPGSGYYKVSFDVYNDVPTIFCVAVFNSNGEIVRQELIDGYSADMYDEMASSFVHFGDWFTGAMWRGESEMYAQKTHVEFDVPLGGYVDFLTLENSQYMAYANIFSGIVIRAMETADAWVDFVKVASADIEFDKIKFAEEVIKLVSDKTKISRENIVLQVMDIVLDSKDYASLATELMGYLLDNGVSLTNLFEILADCSMSALKDLRAGIAKGTLDIALGAVPPAKFFKKLTDAVTTTLQYAIVLKDIASMAGNTNDFLVIVYPAKPVY